MRDIGREEAESMDTSTDFGCDDSNETSSKTCRTNSPNKLASPIKLDSPDWMDRQDKTSYTLESLDHFMQESSTPTPLNRSAEEESYELGFLRRPPSARSLRPLEYNVQRSKDHFRVAKRLPRLSTLPRLITNLPSPVYKLEIDSKKGRRFNSQK
ncbi:hypothetical protein TWF106_006453 [Orbilia oligospora]|uniref:Uncharacterized protein n=1 Tax=Orbilia oligospora TaxID=2813651 RepID=A0A7C8Q3E1_ORBOL|nr:hypothetical protein TWF788_008238 [Orbilia oligospora]KAF3221128.1 hypothetical protein TWF106_006453 [Orbilia oligospora]